MEVSPEQPRAEPSAPERRQLTLPIEQLDCSDAAYLAAAETCGMVGCALAIVSLAIRCGRRDGRARVLRARTQRKVAAELHFSASTVSEALHRLTVSGVLRTTDGEWRFDLGWLVELSEAAQPSGPAATRPPPDRALAALGGARGCSGVLGGARAGSGSVEQEYTSPVSVSVPSPESVRAPSARPEQPAGEPAKMGQAPIIHDRSQSRQAVGRVTGQAPIIRDRSQSLQEHPAWRRLQTRHFRNGGAVQLDRQALMAAFDAAVTAGTIAGDREAKLRFWATAYDLAADQDIRSPAVCLRVRVERNRCYRISEAGRQFAVGLLRPAEYRREPWDEWEDGNGETNDGAANAAARNPRPV